MQDYLIKKWQTIKNMYCEICIIVFSIILVTIVFSFFNINDIKYNNYKIENNNIIYITSKYSNKCYLKGSEPKSMKYKIEFTNYENCLEYIRTKNF